MGTNVTIKGQVTLPKAVRDAAGIRPGDRVSVRLRPEGGVIIEREALGADQSAYLAQLEEIAQKLVTHPEITQVKVTGYTDRLGSVKYNLKLSERRAAAVKAYLVNHGVAADRISTEGLGKADPVTTDCSAKLKHAKLVECLEPDRRVTIEPITIEQAEMPRPGPDDVLIQVKRCGICGSDVHGFDGSTGRRIPPIIMGHEAAGIVEVVGEGVADLSVGDHVVTAFVPSCGHCEPCADGRPALWACVITTVALTASLWMGMVWLAQRFGH